MTELLPMAASCAPTGTLGGWIGTIIFGAVIVSVLARLVLPGKQNINLIITIILGILGALIGYWLAGLSPASAPPAGSTGSAGSSPSRSPRCSS